ncbi:hypothetical protein SPAN111604_13320 [Sphingomonas antarctica]|uniref:DUF3108 domain-containing protein n=1 Tax=Sphingomonas antarctica TaxID=2040274 RepID=UPI0039E774B9
MTPLTSLMLVAAAALSSPAEPVIHTPVGVRPARMGLLTSGVRRYVRYTLKAGRRSPTDLWTRTVSFENHDGTRQLHIVQRWASDGTPSYTIDQDSWFDAATFRPLIHVRTQQHDGKTLVGGYRFAPDRITGMAELPDNTRKNFRLDTPEPPFNFELDMELLQVLPWKPGYVADLVFYDPGQDPPAHYRYRYSGEAAIIGPNGDKIDCLLVSAELGGAKTRFWLAKRTQVVVHEETELDGTLYVKTLIGSEAADQTQA